MTKLEYRLKTFYQYRSLIGELVTRDIKLKYRRSFLGYVWSILNPLLIMIVMTVVFSAMFKRNIENYPVYLLIGRMSYEFMTTSTNAAMNSVVGNSAILKKTYIPKYIFTVSKVTSGFIDFFFSLGALLIVMIFTGATFHPTLILTIYVIVQLYIFCLGVGFFLASANVFFRDMQYIYRAITTAWMYLTPIFYPIEQLPASLQVLIKTVNPMYYYVTQFRSLALYGKLPEMRLFVGGWLFAAGAMIIGLWVFSKNKDEFILYI